MPTLHIDKLRSGEGDEGEYQVVEQAGLPHWGPGLTLQAVGKPMPRVEGKDKVTGRARYAYDVRLPGQLYAKVLRSPHPHARIVRIDATAARQVPGVQKPHWTASCSTNARWTGSSSSPAASPSMVVIWRSGQSMASIRQL